MEKVCVMGLGYVGLPTASLLANNGFKVHGVDVNPKIVELISRGRYILLNRIWIFVSQRRLTVEI